MKKVIIAEEIKALLKKEKSFLERSDIRIFKADTNSRALALHKTEKADLIIAMLDTPDMSGEELCSIIRGDDELRGVSIIIVSSKGEAELERCIKCRANAFVSSPVNNAVLLQEAHQLLNIAPRKACRIPISVKFDGTLKGRPFTGHLEDISSSGMLFRSSYALFEGDTIICTFSLGSDRITAPAEIVRVFGKKPGHDAIYGISFSDINPDAVSAIEAFVKKESAEK